jgi:ketosteroid isomerase-like protein
MCRAPKELEDMVEFRETIISRWLAAGDAGDVDAFDDLLLPDAVIHAPRGLSTTSREAEKAVWQAALVAMPDLRHDLQEVLVGADVEMARVVVTGTLAETFGGVEGGGRSFRMDQAVIVHLRDGRIAEAWEIADVGVLERQVTDNSG